MNRKDLEFALSDWTLDKAKCCWCKKLLKNHTETDLNKCYDDLNDAVREVEGHVF
jgi:hypothetical protein